MKENLQFFKNELDRIKKGLATLEPTKQTQEYVNLMSCGTNLVGFTNQLEALVKSRAEAEKREEENKKAAKEAQDELEEKSK